MDSRREVKFPPKLKQLFQPYRYKVLFGGRGCVHGDTRLLTPSGEMAISEFKGGAVYSLTDAGIEPVLVGPPVEYPPEMLYQVRLSTGETIKTTARHKFLTPYGWHELRQLSAGCSILQPDAHAHDLLGRSFSSRQSGSPADVPHYLRKVLGSLYHYLVHYRLCDGQPHQEAETYQDVLLQLAYGPLHTPRASTHKDVQASLNMHDRQLLLHHLSNLSVVLCEEERNYADTGSCSAGIFSEQLSVILKGALLCQQNDSLHGPIRELAELFLGCGNPLDSTQTHRTICEALLLSLDDSSFSDSLPCDCNLIHHTIEGIIESITECGEEPFFDIFVPFYNNYVAEGMIHHNSSKSWSVARALLVLGAKSKIRILATREVQKSLKDSVHKLLSDQIEAIGLGSFYEVLETTIRGKNGTEFLFCGLSNMTAESIKSFEGIDIVWCEEAQTISNKSWDILIPTIRKEGSEIWVTFNPVLDTDPTYTRFVTNPPPNAFVCFINYYDNPWFPQVLEQERSHCQATMLVADYNNIWEGHCRAAVSGAIYATEVSQAVADNRVANLPYDPSLKVHTVWDLGFADDMAIIMAQRTRSEVRIIDYIQVNNTTTDKCVAMLQTRMYNWGYDFLPHDGFSKERKLGTSDADILSRFGRKVKRIPKTDEESRIKNARMVFPRIAFDRGKTDQLLECLKRYRRGDSVHGSDTSPIHNSFSHGADSFGYMCQVISEMSNDDERTVVPRFESFTPIGNMGY